MKNENGRALARTFFFYLSTSDLYFVAKLCQHFRHTLTVFALDFYRPIFDRPAGAAFLFEFFGEGFQVIFGEDKVLDDGNHLPTPAAGFAMQVDGLLLRRQ